MKEKYAMFKFIFASLACCLLAAAMITGCGGSNNPAGTGLTSATTSTTTDTPLIGAITGSITGRIVSLGGGGTVDSIPVVLEQNSAVIATTQTITSGAYYFANVPQGIYVVRIPASTSYSSSAVLVDLSGTTAAATDLPLISTLSLGDTPRVKIIGTLTAALNGKAEGLSVAQLQLDTGYKTVTNAFGYFELPNVASGERRLNITKPGMSDYSLSFVVKSLNGTSVSSVAYNGETFTPVANTTALGIIPLTYELAPSTIITGTVKQYVRNLITGQLTSEKVFVEGFNFDIWIKPDVITKPYTRVSTIVTENDGTFKIENLPVYAFTLMAVASGTSQFAVYDVDGRVTEYKLQNNNAPWTIASDSFVFTSVYTVTADKTTIMDIVLPTFQTW
ncbi:MAG TPA: hypothetical protein DCG57_00775 [Candidatus Riflebacteria bacterium]|nr:hypothetical protein [Candidatus Riflebacteria bacterium]